MRILLKNIALCLLVFIAVGIGMNADRATVRAETSAAILDHVIKRQQARGDSISPAAAYPELDPTELKARVAAKRWIPWTVVGAVTLGLGVLIICWKPKRVI